MKKLSLVLVVAVLSLSAFAKDETNKVDKPTALSIHLDLISLKSK